MVMVTGTVTLCAGFALDTVIVPEYVPGMSPVGSAVMLTEDDPKAGNVPSPLAALSHGPPNVVVAATLAVRKPPPRFETESVRERAGEFCTNEKTIDVGFRLRLGCPAAVTVIATAMVAAGGLALGAEMLIEA
jgi:hypothetical protein